MAPFTPLGRHLVNKPQQYKYRWQPTECSVISDINIQKRIFQLLVTGRENNDKPAECKPLPNYENMLTIVDGEANDVEDIEFLKIHKILVEADNDCEDDERKKEKSGRSTRAVD